MPGGRRCGQARDLQAKQVRSAERIGRIYRVSSLEQCSSVDDFALAEAARWNLAALASPIDIVNTDYRTGLANLIVPMEGFPIAPPWGDALYAVSLAELKSRFDCRG